MSDITLAAPGKELTGHRHDYHYEKGDLLFAPQYGVVIYQHAVKAKETSSVELVFPRTAKGAEVVSTKALRRINRLSKLQEVLGVLTQANEPKVGLGSDTTFVCGDIIETVKLMRSLARKPERTKHDDAIFRKAVHLVASEFAGYVALHKHPTQSLKNYYTNVEQMIHLVLDGKAPRELTFAHVLDAKGAVELMRPPAPLKVKEPKPRKVQLSPRTKNETPKDVLVVAAPASRLIKREEVPPPTAASSPSFVASTQMTAASVSETDELYRVAHKDYTAASVFGSFPTKPAGGDGDADLRKHTLASVFGPSRPALDSEAPQLPDDVG